MKKPHLRVVPRNPVTAPSERSFSDFFRLFAQGTARAAGSPWLFLLAFVTIVVWGITGPIFGFSDTWQLVINTATTIVTFLMVFLIQNTQNRETTALHLKLDELLRAHKGARTRLVDLEKLNDKEIEKLQAQFDRIHEEAEKRAVRRTGR